MPPVDLKEMGVDVWMVTGDNRGGPISRQLNLSPDRVISEASSCQSAASSQASGRIRVVVMGRDGLTIPRPSAGRHWNEPGTGAEIAAEASDIVLVRETCAALDLSRAIFRKKSSGTLYFRCSTIVWVSLSQGVFYPLWSIRDYLTVAAIAMALSSISVVLSSLSLFRPPNVSISIADVAVETVHLLFGRSMQQRNTQGNHDDNDLAVRLLDNDHLAASEAENTDNRSLSRKKLERPTLSRRQ
jgi:magnesium-transporting ATPase (P-type)